METQRNPPNSSLSFSASSPWPATCMSWEKRSFHFHREWSLWLLQGILHISYWTESIFMAWSYGASVFLGVSNGLCEHWLVWTSRGLGGQFYNFIPESCVFSKLVSRTGSLVPVLCQELSWGHQASLPTSSFSQEAHKVDSVHQWILWLSNTQGPGPQPNCMDPFAPSFKHSCTIGCHHPTNRMHELPWKSLECSSSYFFFIKYERMDESSWDAQLLLCHGAQLGSEPLEQLVYMAGIVLSASFY